MRKHVISVLVIVLAIFLMLPPTDGFCGKKKKRSSGSKARVTSKVNQSGGTSRESRIISRAVGERWWIFGRVRGNGNVVTIKAKHLTDPSRDYEFDTSTNKRGQYAFSDVGQGDPGEYKLIIYSGDREIKQVSLRGLKTVRGIRNGLRIPDISIK